MTTFLLAILTGAAVDAVACRDSHGPVRLHGSATGLGGSKQEGSRWRYGEGVVEDVFPGTVGLAAGDFRGACSLVQGISVGIGAAG